jgi:2-polyprenyl-3-methyl-5-hydroxy-6-metoxy-1,4-benzoquinol methylase
MATEEDLYYCYRLLLGREPDQTGWANWMKRVENQSINLEGLTRAFLHSAEHRRLRGPKVAGRPDPVQTNRQPGALWKTLQLLIAGSKGHAFLDHAWLPWLFRITPRRLKTPLALRLLSFSPHYFIYQWTDRYPAALPHAEVLRQEFERNAASRRQLCERLVSRFVRSDMAVLDFGCGPGYLAREVSAHAGRVVATDISRGVIACAEHLNPAPNLKYVANGPSDLARVEDGSIDLVYSFAVFQHLLKEQTRCLFQEFARVLKPRGMGVIHTIIRSPDDDLEMRTGRGWVEERVKLRMVYFTEREIEALLHEAGFSHVEIARVATICEIEDDIGNEHLVKFRR